MKDKDLVKLLLETIQELYDSPTNKTIVDYKDYEWFISLQDIKQLDIKNKYIQFYTTNDTEKICSITKPKHEQCPIPDTEISVWIKPGWQISKNEVTIINTINDEKFNDNPKRISLYEEWLNKRQNWINEEFYKEKVLELFNKLSKIIDDFNLDFDKQELLISTGLISIPRIDKKINYPILTQKVSIKFDNNFHNTISIYTQDEIPNIETKFLSELTTIVNRYIEDNSLNLKLINNRLPEILAFLSEKNINILNKDDTITVLKEALILLTDNGKFINDTDTNDYPEEYLLMRYNPTIIYRKRTIGLDDFIERINNDIKLSDTKIPKHFISLLKGKDFSKPELIKDLTTDEKITQINGTFEDILLTKPSNKEQLRIIKEINRNDVVEVQGPPGTGKTHTIANILGHFLAQGKKVLVVSEKPKALEVIQDKLEPEIRDLCVPVLYGSNEKLKKAISGIIYKNTSETLSNLQKKVNDLTQKRKALIDELHHLQFNLFNIRNNQIKKILFRQKYYSPIDIGKFISDNKDYLSLIPGEISKMDNMPINQDEINLLFKANHTLSLSDEKELSLPLPILDTLLTKETVKNLFEEYNTIEKNIKTIKQELNQNLEYNNGNIYLDKQIVFSNPEKDSLEELKTYIKNLPAFDDWFITVCLAKKQSEGYANTWKMLSKKIEEYITLANEYIPLSYTTNITIDNSADFNKLLSCVDCVIQKYTGKSDFNFLNKLLDNKLKYVLANIKINDNDIKNSNDCILAKKYLTLKQCKQQLSLMWDKSFKETSMSSFNDISIFNLNIFENVKKQINTALLWFDEVYTQLMSIGKKAHINLDLITFNSNEYQSEQFKDYYDTLRKVIINYIDITENYIRLNSIKERLYSFNEVLNNGSILCDKLYKALTSFNYDEYCVAYDEYDVLLRKKEIFNAKEDILKKIYPVAKDWADSFKTGNNIYPPKDINFDLAWQVKRFKSILDDIYSDSEDELVNKINTLTSDLYKITTHLVCTKAWYHNLNYCQQRKSILSSLNNYIQYNKKIGAGKGKYTSEYRKAAQKSMIDCQLAVPAWIMSVSEAINRFDPAHNHFDVMIIDEASQSSLNVLILTYLADKLIVVGDDKQVSPLAIGNDMQRQQDIVNKKLKGILKDPQLFRTDTSFYDLMANLSMPIMLREHFRCMPAIIGYCNKYFYDGKIRPLRDGNNNPIKPSIINFPVNGKRDIFSKINDIEAKTIVAIIKYCLELDEYKNKTFGVVSLLGKEQSEYIRQLLSEKIGSKIMEERNIICGEPAYFQGDERDIILLSTVDDQTSIRTITKTGNRGAAGQRYNVAVSRAKDQVWVVNSFNYNLLKEDDIRHELLDYAEHSDEYMLQKENIAKESDSPFEEEVASYLVDHGYHIKQQYPVGAYRIDIVVFFENSRIAIECDGERYHSSPDKVLADMEREEILKRIGNWKFIRIRGGLYYANKDATLSNVVKQLEKNHIYPEKSLVKESIDTDKSLLNEIRQKVEYELKSWSDIPENELQEITSNPISQKEISLEKISSNIKINEDNSNPKNIEKNSSLDIQYIFKLVPSETWFKLSKLKSLNSFNKKFAYSMGRKDKNFQPTEKQSNCIIALLKQAYTLDFDFGEELNNILKNDNI